MTERLLTVGDFADATGLTPREAERWRTYHDVLLAKMAPNPNKGRRPCYQYPETEIPVGRALAHLIDTGLARNSATLRQILNQVRDNCKPTDLYAAVSLPKAAEFLSGHATISLIIHLDRKRTK